MKIMYKINVSNTRKNISMLLNTFRFFLFSFEITLFFQFGRIELKLTFQGTTHFSNYAYIHI